MMIFLKLYWKEISISTIIFLFGFYVSSVINGYKISNIKNEFNNYKLTVTQEYAKQEKLTAEAIKFYVNSKVDSDEAYNKSIADLKSTVNRLRNERASKQYLPTNTSGAPESDRICFNRNKFSAAVRQLDEGFSDIAGESDSCRVKLINIKNWYKTINK